MEAGFGCGQPVDTYGRPHAVAAEPGDTEGGLLHVAGCKEDLAGTVGLLVAHAGLLMVTGELGWEVGSDQVGYIDKPYGIHRRPVTEGNH